MARADVNHGAMCVYEVNDAGDAGNTGHVGDVGDIAMREMSAAWAMRVM